MKESDLSLAHEKFEELGIAHNAIQTIYPKIIDKLIPLSNTGVEARVFFHWKKYGLIDWVEESEKRAWVKLNIYQYLWVIVIKTLREFGIPLEEIKKGKDSLFRDIMQDAISNMDIYMANIKKGENFYKEEHINSLKTIFELYKRNITAISKEELINNTLFANIINRIFLYKEKASLLVVNTPNSFAFFPILFNNDPLINKAYSEILKRPHLHIPLNNLLGEFIEEEDNTKYANAFGLFNQQEEEVIKALRSKDFKELKIKLDKKNTLIIEKTTDGDYMNEKVREIRKILGLKEYEEVELIMRNNKHIHFKKKVKSKI